MLSDPRLHLHSSKTQGNILSLSPHQTSGGKRVGVLLDDTIYAYILTPTRELAYQISEQVNAFGAQINIRVQVVIGGTDILVVTEAKQLSEAPHIVIATPG